MYTRTTRSMNKVKDEEIARSAPNAKDEEMYDS